MKWYIWVLIVVVLFAAGYFTGDMVAKNKAAKLAKANAAKTPVTTVNVKPIPTQVNMTT